MTTQALVALGSNLGDRRAHLSAAVAALEQADGVLVRAVSSYHETPPVGGPGGQGAFLNAAARLDTSLHPLALLRLLQDLEQRAGRVRTTRWGERPLDLDIVLFGDRRLRLGKNTPLGPELVVPHPRFALRRFVLAPLAELAPGAVDPLTGRTINTLLENLDRRPSCLAFHDPAGRLPGHLLDRVVADFEAHASDNDRWQVIALRPDANRPPIAPTFAVVPRPAPPDLIPQAPVPFPILGVDPADPEAALADILAACAGTRAGA